MPFENDISIEKNDKAHLVISTHKHTLNKLDDHNQCNAIGYQQQEMTLSVFFFFRVLVQYLSGEK